jgi:putative membrane protein
MDMVAHASELEGISMNSNNVINDGTTTAPPTTTDSNIWDRLLLGDTRSFPSTLAPVENFDRYKSYSLVQSMMLYKDIREAALCLEGKAQREYTSSNEGWLATLFMIRGRALDRIALPWAFITLHAIVYTVLQETVFSESIETGTNNLLNNWEVVFGFVLSSTLAFLLVFRLQRAADRYWTARFYWGDLVAKGRTLISGLVVHGTCQHRDHAIRWLIAHTVAIMEQLRGRTLYDGSILAGILTLPELKRLENSKHPPIHAMTKVRHHLRQAFHNTPDTPLSVAVERSQILNRLEQLLNSVQDCGGGMERIKSTPLPVVHVSHLRTFLIATLL